MPENGNIEYVKSLLENYHEIKSWTEQMRVRLDHPQHETLEDTIESLSFPAAPIKDKVQSSHSSDRVSIIASIYQHVNYQVTQIKYNDVERIVVANEIALKQLECAVRGLRHRYRVPVEEYYFERKTIAAIAEEYGWSEKTVRRNRDRGTMLMGC